MKQTRLKLTPKDIVILKGCSESYARRVVREIKKIKNKNKNQFITPREFAEFYGIELIDIYATLGWEYPKIYQENPETLKSVAKS